MSPSDRFAFDCCWLPAYFGLWVLVGWWAAALLFVAHCVCNATVTKIKPRRSRAALKASAGEKEKT